MKRSLPVALLLLLVAGCAPVTPAAGPNVPQADRAAKPTAAAAPPAAPRRGGTVRTGYNEIASITAPDDATVVVTYKQLYAAYKGAFPWILPAHAFSGDTLIDKKDFNRAPLGSGPFKFKAWASGDTIVLERSPNY